MDIIQVLNNPVFYVEQSTVYKDEQAIDSPPMKLVFPNYVTGDRLGVTTDGSIYDFSTETTYTFDSKVLAVYTGNFDQYNFLIWFANKEVRLFTSLDSKSSTLRHTDVLIFTRVKHMKHSNFIVVFSNGECLHGTKFLTLPFAPKDVVSVLHNIFHLSNGKVYELTTARAIEHTRYNPSRKFQRSVRLESC